jgi:prenylcysteine oxidase/farnesylcysteine lyase
MKFSFNFISLFPFLLECKRVAIIGAGAGGSSVAYHLFKQFNNSFQITIFEKSNQIGGRVRNIEIGHEIVEVGASIFVSENYLLVNISKELDLPLVPPFRRGSNKKIDSSFGIWNGNEFVFRSSAYFFWTNLKFLWRYHLNFQNAQHLSKKYLSTWINVMYGNNNLTFNSVEDMINTLGFEETIQKNAKLFFSQHGIYKSDFITEFLAGITRTNYGQDTNDIHAWGAFICLIAASSDLHAIEGGNQRLFEKMIRYSKASIKFNSAVKNITKIGSKYLVQSMGGRSSKEEGLFDYVVLASPLVNNFLFFLL